jgi:metal-dependent amidase/aminoacylase/carboxypeptidase family protein
LSIDFILEAKKLKENIANLRRTIHMNPELGFEEHATAQLVENTV